MKKLIKASRNNKVIFEDKNFALIEERGVGINDTPWTGLEVKTKDGSLAEKHVVEIRLNTIGRSDFNGTPVVREYSDAYVAHGMRGSSDSLKETMEYIDVLEDAVDFAVQVNDWLASGNW